MHKVIHQPNYLLRYLACFAIAGIVYFTLPQLLAWPLRVCGVFFIFAISLLCLKHQIGDARLAPLQILGQLNRLWLWQCGAAITLLLLQYVCRALFYIPALTDPVHDPFLAFDITSKISLAACMTTTLAYVVYRKAAPLTLVPLFPAGSHALTRRIIFCHAWLRDSCSFIALLGFSASFLLLVGRYIPALKTHATTAFCGGFLLTFYSSRWPKAQRGLRWLSARYGFASTIVVMATVFLVTTILCQQLFHTWTITGLSWSLQLPTLNPYSFFQCLSLLIIAPLVFRTAAYCRGLSLRGAIIGQCFNPYFGLALWGTCHWQTTLTAYVSSSLVLDLAALCLMTASLCYLGSPWFANVTERLFSNDGHKHTGHLRWFFNQRLQLALLLFLWIASGGWTAVIFVLLGGVALGAVLVYIHLFFFFWQRL